LYSIITETKTKQNRYIKKLQFKKSGRLKKEKYSNSERIAAELNRLLIFFGSFAGLGWTFQSELSRWFGSQNILNISVPRFKRFAYRHSYPKTVLGFLVQKGVCC
jgi:hypothetical protein